MTSFKPRQVGKGREREKINKNRSDGFRPDPKQKIAKKQQKSSKIKKHLHNFFSRQNRFGKDEKERKKKSF